MFAHSPECARRHDCKGKFRFCEECKRTYSVTKTPHDCSMTTCSNCFTRYRIGDPHRCFVRRLSSKTPAVRRFGCFDFECGVSGSKHVPIYASWILPDQPNTVLSHLGTDCVDVMMRSNLQHGQNATFVAHNGGAYDFQFVTWYLRAANLYAYIARDGSKIKFVRIPSVKIELVDSLNHFPMSLDNRERVRVVCITRRQDHPYGGGESSLKHFRSPSKIPRVRDYPRRAVLYLESFQFALSYVCRFAVRNCAFRTSTHALALVQRYRGERRLVFVATKSQFRIRYFNPN